MTPKDGVVLLSKSDIRIRPNSATGPTPFSKVLINLVK